MVTVTPEVETRGSNLCLSCGACCGWAVLWGVPIRGEEIDWAKRRKLPLLQKDGQVVFRLPCPVLRTKGDEHSCADYEHRPSRCKAFRCSLLRRFDTGEVTLEAALDVVRELRGRVERIEQRLRGRSGDMEAKLGAIGGREDAEVLLDLALVRMLVRREILDTSE